jgi:hypothetical protein
MALQINGRTLDDLVFQHLTQDGHLAPALARRRVVDRGDGAPVWASTLVAGERVITQVVDLRPASLADRVTLQDAIADRCAGVCELITTDAPDRRWWAVLDARVPELVTAPYASPIHVLTLRWRCQDARAEAVEPTLVALSGTPAALPLGASACAPVVTLFGAATPVVAPVIVCRYGSGARESRLTLSGSLGTGQSLTIDAARETVWLTSGGTTLQALDRVVDGLFPVLDPADGPVTLHCEATSGTPTGVARYRRMW